MYKQCFNSRIVLITPFQYSKLRWQSAG